MKGRQTITIFASIMIITSLSTAETAYAEIPDWIKDVACFWANGDIDDETYLNIISCLVDNGYTTLAGPQDEPDSESDRRGMIILK